MKFFLYALCLLATLSGCSKEEDEPQLLVVTAADLAGTWVYENPTSGATEIMKFTADGDFFLTADLAEASFEGHKAGIYSMVSSDASVTANQDGVKRAFTITALTKNSLTIRHKTSGETATYAKLAILLDLSYDEPITPDYEKYIEGKLKGFRSHNDKVATINKNGTITGKSEGITLLDILTSEGTAVIIVKVGSLIYDYAQTIGMTKNEICATFINPVMVSEEMVWYQSDDKMTRYSINKRTKLVDAVHVSILHKDYSNAALIEYLSNKYYVYKTETIGNIYAFTNRATYESSNVKITFDGSSNLTYSYINHDLFEDFSIALGKTRDEVQYMYGGDLEAIIDLPSILEYTIGDEILGYAGTDIMEEVKFSFDNNITFMVELRLSTHLKQESVIHFFQSRYTYSTETTAGRHSYFYDKSKNLVIDYIAEDKLVRYYNEK